MCVMRHIMRRIVGRSPGGIRAMFFTVGSARIREKRGTGIRRVTSCLGGRPSDAILIVNSTSGRAKGRGVGACLHTGHTHIITRVLIGRFNVRGSHIGPLVNGKIGRSLCRGRCRGGHTTVYIVARLRCR